MISERVKRLREQSVSTRPYISSERAEFVTEFYQSGVSETVSTPVARALLLQYVLARKSISIGEGELIVGERGPGPRGTPTYPEQCCHSLEDLDVTNSRHRQPFIVDDQVRMVYRDSVIPFWKGRTMRERIFASMTREWLDAYEAGVFTEFMEQRAPGHAVLDDKIYRKGLRDLKQEAQEHLERLDYFNDPDAYKKEQELRAMQIAADALIGFAHRYAKLADELAQKETNQERRMELRKIAEVCTRVPAHAPRDFWEALQSYWFVHLGIVTELNVWDSFNPGRLDQHLHPFYRKGLEEGSLTKEFAKELLQCFWIKFNNQPAPPKVAVTEEQSATYQDFALINVGGVTLDGLDAVNELSYMILDVVEEMRLIMPSACIQLSKQNPDPFLMRAVKVAKAGFGQPSMFNTDVIVQEFLRVGKSVQDARGGGPSGCVEISAFGKESCINTGYMNLPKIFEITLNNGADPLTRKKVGIGTGDPSKFNTFEELAEAYGKQLQYFVDVKIRGNNVIERLYAEKMPAPFMSLICEDCIAKGKDYNDGGPRYNSTYIQGTGIGTLADCLSAVKYHVFDNHKISMPRLLDALRTNFEGSEEIRQMLLNWTPKYGNDDDYADSLAQWVFNTYFDAIDGRPNTKDGHYHVNVLSTTVHVYFGQLTGATPDGRRAREPISEGISPGQGADRNGPTAVVKSVSKIDHALSGGTLLNQKFMPQLLSDEQGMTKLGQLVRTYFRLNGHHVQFNIVDAETLRDAQRNPEKHRDLIVRVAGYSDYFVDLGKELQEEIISRTEHQVL